MKRTHILGMVVLAVLVTSQIVLAYDVTNNPSYMELAATPRLLTAETANNAGEIGMWEYVYDLYGGGASQLARWGVRGFDPSMIVNQSPLATGWGGGVLNQQWNAQAASNNSYSSFYDDFGTMGSYAGTYVNPDRGMNGDPNEWVVPPTCRVGDVGDYGIINTWYTPSEYVAVSFAGTKRAGRLNLEGEYMGAQFDAGTSGYEIDGLFHTFRIVHPNAPGNIEWWSYSYNPGTGTTAFGTILGPGSGGIPGDFSGDGSVNAVDIDILADAIEAGSTDLTYDVYVDGVIDEQDLIHHIATLVERTGGVGTYRGDFNLDGYVDGTDLAILKAGFGLTGLGYAAGNCNADDFVNGTDLAIFKATFGFSGTPGDGIPPNNPAPVPEPATLSLLGLGAAALLRRRK